jgi:hypothetical protein
MIICDDKINSIFKIKVQWLMIFSLSMEMKISEKFKPLHLHVSWWASCLSGLGFLIR